MRRREFITLLGCATALPLNARAQQSGRVRRVGVLVLYNEDDREGQLRARAFQEGLQARGWVIGSNLVIDFRWGVGDLDWIRSKVNDLMDATPEVILANSDQMARAVQSVSKTIPIVFIGASDPIAQGFVRSLAHPGGNMTGFSILEPSLGPKWIEILKEIAPQVKRVAVLLNSENAGSLLLFRSSADAANKFGVEVFSTQIRKPAEIEAAFETLARETAIGFILPPDPSIAAHRKLIVEMAARYRIPGVYALPSFAAEGGLISYGIIIPEVFRQAADYVDRILRGDKPGDLPVQRPTKFELTINIKTAQALGLTVSPTLLARADRVIE
ncbi:MULTISPECIES: ABC transporter substrate-binding protein [unclassified Bradyrhizobium]|uniref:ABC transporter substrate-binding protein n=1 Tax=unclassified Bradyrhizobium TaxID=2631580 RepID=UPI001BAB0C93|nr:MULTISPECIES: ABC transporter substrate-binding protein [unclassified Bradyrhizobium]MBR1157460.1 ABC transporter substrate-binding protein [Bradyrhizobium sp. JYMT SZCCT0428]MBR1213037.1 ABC transporter substrate-binding protein [Bradyrhizobium sp. JYMT SZCCT0180]